MKFIMKKIALSIATASIMATSSFGIFGVGDIVFDPVQTTKAVAEYAEQAKRWIEEVNHYKSQIEAYEKELLAATEIRDSVQFMKDIKEFNNFTKNYSLDFLDLKDDILGNPKSQVGQYAKQLFDKYQVFDDCNEEYMNDNQKKICKNEMVRNVQEVATYQAYKDNLSSVSTKLGDLSQKLANSKDIKESQDIQNAIQMEIAQLEVAKAQVELMDTQNKSLRSIEQRQKEQLYKQNRTKQAEWK